MTTDRLWGPGDIRQTSYYMAKMEGNIYDTRSRLTLHTPSRLVPVTNPKGSMVIKSASPRLRATHGVIEMHLSPKCMVFQLDSVSCGLPEGKKG
jgi:hypothetical protein